jgi:hypothetical protein
VSFLRFLYYFLGSILVVALCVSGAIYAGLAFLSWVGA